MKTEQDSAEQNDTTTLEDLQAMQEVTLAYCYDNDISIEDADL